jgi:hypothetical protein
MNSEKQMKEEKKLNSRLLELGSILGGLRREINNMEKIYHYRDKLILEYRNEDFSEWIYKLGYTMNKISDDCKIIKMMEDERDKLTTEEYSIQNKLRSIQSQYNNTRYFDTTRIKPGMIFNIDGIGGGANYGLPMKIVRATKTYIEGYFIGSIIIHKFKYPKSVTSLYSY